MSVDSRTIQPRNLGDLGASIADISGNPVVAKRSVADSADEVFTSGIPVSARSLFANLDVYDEDTAPSLLDTISIVYQAFVAEVPDEDRQQVFQYVLKKIQTGELDAATIAIFIRHEPNHYLARSAVTTYLLRKTVDDSTPFSATEQVVSILMDDEIANRGAVYAGLVCFGDRRVCSIARTIRDTITPAEMRAFAVSVPSPLHRTSIEFCISWLTELVTNKKFEMAIPVASALSSMVIKDSTLIVHDVVHNFGPFGFSSDTIAPNIPYEDLLMELTPILDSLSESDHPMLNHMVGIIREPRSSSLDQLERRERSSRRERTEQRASDRRIVDIRPHIDRRSLERRGGERRTQSRR